MNGSGWAKRLRNRKYSVHLLSFGNMKQQADYLLCSSSPSSTTIFKFSENPTNSLQPVWISKTNVVKLCYFLLWCWTPSPWTLLHSLSEIVDTNNSWFICAIVQVFQSLFHLTNKGGVGTIYPQIWGVCTANLSWSKKCVRVLHHMAPWTQNPWTPEPLSPWTFFCKKLRKTSIRRQRCTSFFDKKTRKAPFDSFFPFKG